MAREIKFRGLNGNKMVFGDVSFFIENGEKYASIESRNCNKIYPVKISTIGQYTGLKDKNGKEIYESDLLKFHGYNAIFKIVFEAAGFVVQRASGEAGVPFGGSLSVCDFQRTFTNGSFNFEVIGNIYENKNLIDK